MTQAKKPTPKVVREVCSMCGLDWALHGASPTTETCIGLLLGEVAALRAQLAHRPAVYPITPYYPRPWPLPWGWTQVGARGTGGTGHWQNVPTNNSAIPRALSQATT